MHGARIVWQNTGDFAAGDYSRAHTWYFDGGAVVAASSIGPAQVLGRLVLLGLGARLSNARAMLWSLAGMVLACVALCQMLVERLVCVFRSSQCRRQLLGRHFLVPLGQYQP